MMILTYAFTLSNINNIQIDIAFVFIYDIIELLQTSMQLQIPILHFNKKLYVYILLLKTIPLKYITKL